MLHQIPFAIQKAVRLNLNIPMFQFPPILEHPNTWYNAHHLCTLSLRQFLQHLDYPLPNAPFQLLDVLRHLIRSRDFCLLQLFFLLYQLELIQKVHHQLLEIPLLIQYIFLNIFRLSLLSS